MLDWGEDLDGPAEVSLAILGCGKMGTAILQGLLSAPPSKEINIVRITVTVRTQSAVSRILHTVQSYLHSPMPSELKNVQVQTRLGPPLMVKMQDENGLVVQDCNVVLLGCKPNAFQDIIRDPGVHMAFLYQAHSKILVSIMGGVTTAQLTQCLYGTASGTSTQEGPRRCAIIRAIPNIAARIQQSITVISAETSVYHKIAARKVSQLFSLVGPVIQLPETQFNNASALASSSVAFYASLISSSSHGSILIEGGKPLSREEALWISAQAARGASSLILDGMDPLEILSQVASRGGSTEVGLKVMEEQMIGTAMASAVSSCAKATAGLSKNQ